MFFDINDGDFILGNMDSDGHQMIRMSDDTAMDLDTGELHFISGWDDDSSWGNSSSSAWDDED